MRLRERGTPTPHHPPPTRTPTPPRAQVPSVLIEACKFWQGEDLLLRGEPRDKKSEWLNYRVEVTINDDGSADIARCLEPEHNPGLALNKRIHCHYNKQTKRTGLRL